MGRHNNQNNNNNNYYNNQYYDQNGQYYDNQYYGQNDQYYNGQYNQGYNQPQNNNGNNKLLDKPTIIAISIMVGILIIALIIFFVVKNNNSEGNETTDPPVETETRVVGNDTLGYVTIPSDWLKFQDVNATRGLQYSDKDGIYIVTLDALSTDQIDAKTYAAGVAGKLENEKVSQLTGATVNLAGYTAYQVYGYYEKNDIWLVVWCFEAEDGNTHYIGVEGPDSNSEYFNIPNTFRLKK